MTSVLFHCLLHTHLIDLLQGNWTLSFARKLNYAFLLQWDLSNCVFDLAVSYWMLNNKSVQERPGLFSLDCVCYAAFAYGLALCNSVCWNIGNSVFFPCPVSVYRAIKTHWLLCCFTLSQKQQNLRLKTEPFSMPCPFLLQLETLYVPAWIPAWVQGLKSRRKQVLWKFILILPAIKISA